MLSQILKDRRQENRMNDALILWATLVEYGGNLTQRMRLAHTFHVVRPLPLSGSALI
jgi:hypothetical protein